VILFNIFIVTAEKVSSTELDKVTIIITTLINNDKNIIPYWESVNRTTGQQ